MQIITPSILNNFLDQLTNEITEVGIDINGLQIDHVAYSTSTTEEYEAKLPELLEEAELIQEAIISDRRVAVIKLNTPVSYGSHSIEVVELIEPKAGQETFSGWEHAEFLVENYDDLLVKYPHLDWDMGHKDDANFSRVKLTLPSKREVKFLDTPVLESVKLEKSGQ